MIESKERIQSMVNSVLKQQKRDLRIKLKQAILNMDAETRLKEETDCINTLIKHPLWLNSDVILCYLAMDSEFSWDKLIDLYGKKRFIAVPVIKEGRMSFYRIKQTTDSAPGPWNIRIPKEGSKLWQPGREQVLCLTPGRAFTNEGHRMGHGGGYYDRLIERRLAVHIGTCYSVQIVKELPCEDHDQTVNGLLSRGKFTVDLD